MPPCLLRPGQLPPFCPPLVTLPQVGLLILDTWSKCLVFLPYVATEAGELASNQLYIVMTLTFPMTRHIYLVPNYSRRYDSSALDICPPPRRGSAIFYTFPGRPESLLTYSTRRLASRRYTHYLSLSHKTVGVSGKDEACG